MGLVVVYERWGQPNEQTAHCWEAAGRGLYGGLHCQQKWRHT